jgi:fused signal recognition particle receptor
MAFKWFKKKNKDVAPEGEEMLAEEDDLSQAAPVSEERGAAPVEVDPPRPLREETPIPEMTGTAEAEPSTHAATSTDPSLTGFSSFAETEQEDPGEVNEPAPAAAGGIFGRLKKGLAKTRQILTTDIEDLFESSKGIDDEMLEELEELLITADLGVKTAMDLVAKITKKAHKINGPKALKNTIRDELLQLLAHAPETVVNGDASPSAVAPKPKVVMVVGVNGVGKTTTIGKIAAKASRDGQKVIIAAADTFRAAAAEQLTIWAERAGAQIVRHKDNADPAAVAFDGVEAATARKADLLLIDTAGRLHTKVNLMEELKKIQRTVAKRLPGAPHEVLLVLDATTGQNALSQAKLFNEAMGVTGLALTKLDGTAKGGIVVSICSEMQLPLEFVGVGEGVDDLQVFDPKAFVKALF